MRINIYNPLVVLYSAAVKRIYKTYGKLKERLHIARQRKRFDAVAREMRAVFDEFFEG